MNNIIQDFAENFIFHIEKYLDNLFEGEKKNISELIEIMQQDMDKTLITQFGEVKYQRTYYASKNSKNTDYTYLVDDIFGIKRYQRMDKGLELDLVEKAEEHSYQKAANNASKVVPLSKQTTLNKIKKLGKIDNRATDEKLEDEKDKSGNKVTKLVYVHEGREGVRNKLKNTKFFSGIYNKSEDLWEEVLSYIYSNWAGIENYANDPNAEGCSVEGHVSHVLASRMSSRPLAWSEDGADRMARLRAFK